MPVAFRSAAGDSGTGTASTSLGIPKPAGVVDGDFLVASIAIAGGAAATATAPTGWTLLRRIDNGTTVGLAIFYRFAQGEPAQWVWTFGSSNTHSGGVSAYVGVDSFFSVDAELGQALAPSTSQPSPSITTSLANLVCVLSYACATSTTYTPPNGTSQRVMHAAGGLGNTTILTCDTTLGAAGPSGAFTAGAGSSASATHALALRPSVGTVTADQARSTVKSHFPPGADDLYDWNATDSTLFALMAAEAQFVKSYGFDWIDLLRQEFQPATATVKLADWEAALGISLPTQNPGVAAWTATRQAKVVGKLRESGTVTADQIRAACEPLLGYSGANIGTLKIVETTRGDFTLNTPGGLCQPHTYTDGGTTNVSASSSATITIKVADDAAVSTAGVQLKFSLTSTNPEQLSFTLTGPTGANGQATVSWASGVLPVGNASGAQFYLADINSSPGKSIFGTWSLTVTATGAATCAVSNCYLYVEGAGRDSAGNDGLGAAIFDWGVQPEIAKVGAQPDYAGVRRALSRMTPAFALPHVIFQTQDAGQVTYSAAIPDAANSIPDSCIPG